MARCGGGAHASDVLIVPEHSNNTRVPSHLLHWLRMGAKWDNIAGAEEDIIRAREGALGKRRARVAAADRASGAHEDLSPLPATGPVVLMSDRRPGPTRAVWMGAQSVFGGQESLKNGLRWR